MTVTFRTVDENPCSTNGIAVYINLRCVVWCQPTAIHFTLLVVALAHSRLDYSNGVLVGLPTYTASSPIGAC